MARGIDFGNPPAGEMFQKRAGAFPFEPDCVFGKVRLAVFKDLGKQRFKALFCRISGQSVFELRLYRFRAHLPGFLVIVILRRKEPAFSIDV